MEKLNNKLQEIINEYEKEIEEMENKIKEIREKKSIASMTLGDYYSDDNEKIDKVIKVFGDYELYKLNKN